MTLRHPIAALLASAAAGCAAAPDADVPAAIAAPATAALLTTVHARGVQVYACRGGAAGHAWAFIAPEAELFDAAGRRIGDHGAGPYWRADDGSRIEGRVSARADAPVPGAIPWLLLETRSTGPAGMLAGVTRVQRIRTHGGLPPEAACTEAHAGATARTAYTADYRLFINR